MIFEPGELEPVRLNITPRVCTAGIDGAIWSVAYGKQAATHVWDTYASRGFANTPEIQRELYTERLRLEAKREPANEIDAMRAIVLRSGFYRLAATKTPDETTISLSTETATALQSAADAMGISLEDYLKHLSNQKNQG